MHRFAVATAFVAFLLLAVGGIVTSRDAGMVFPDWPLSLGSVNPEGWLHDADMLSVEHLAELRIRCHLLIEQVREGDDHSVYEFESWKS